MKLSILMAAYNEERTVAQAVSAVLDAEYPCPVELIVVDDGSGDRTSDLLAGIDDPRLTVHRHGANRGKGAALYTAIGLATGTHMLPFDADLEYAATDIPALVWPVLKGRCEVVYGTRLFGANTAYQSFGHAVGNKALTLAANILFDANITDLHTCLKLVPLPLVRALRLSSSGFGMDTELTAGVLRLGYRPFEVPVSYHSRSRAEGKKITWQDGVACLRILATVRFTPRAKLLSRRPVAAPASASEPVSKPAPKPASTPVRAPAIVRSGIPLGVVLPAMRKQDRDRDRDRDRADGAPEVPLVLGEVEAEADVTETANGSLLGTGEG